MPMGLHVCAKCGHEKDRHPRQNGSYKYTCGCVQWKLAMAVLGHAQKGEEKRRTRSRS